MAQADPERAYGGQVGGIACRILYRIQGEATSGLGYRTGLLPPFLPAGAASHPALNARHRAMATTALHAFRPRPAITLPSMRSRSSASRLRSFGSP